MKKVVKQMRLINIQMVDDCPFKDKPIMRCPDASDKYVEYERTCAQCAFNIDGKTHGWEIHELPITRFEEEDEPDPCGGLPQGGYQYTISCVRCGNKCTDYSGLSSMCRKDTITCNKCSTPHILMKGGYNKGTFYVPLQKEK
jgi:hypothetical protein